MKLCSTCKINPTTSPEQTYCSGCRSSYSKIHFSNNKEIYKLAKIKQIEKIKKWLIDYKLSRGCKVHGLGLPVECYEFNHTGKKFKNVSKLHRYSLKRVKEEIEQCELLCRNCHKDHTYKEYRNFESRITTNPRILEKREIINNYKSKPCMDCGETFNYWITEFDHRRGTKRYAIKHLMYNNCSIKTLMEEIEKCDVVCGNCHTIRTIGDRSEFRYNTDTFC